MTGDDLLGVWQMLSAGYEHAETGAPIPSHYGDNPTAFLHYTPGGRMIALIMAGDLPLLGPDHLTASLEDRAAVHSGTIAYAGRYRMDGDAVLHQVEAATIPDWIGTEQRRYVVIDGDHLTLRSAPQTSGRIITAHWRRLE
jgi:hypothetical protein